MSSILDASKRLGLELSRSFDAFLDVRYAGGARGTEEDNVGPGDGCTDNWLYTVAVTYIE